MNRRQVLSAASGMTVLGVAAASPLATATTSAGNVATAEDTLTQNGSVRYEASEERFVYEFKYDIPDNLSEVTISVDALDWREASVLESRNLSRDGGTSFVWSGGATPKLVVESRPSGSTLPDRRSGTYAVGSVAFETRLRTALSFRYSGTAPSRRRTMSFEGEGFAGDGCVYAGPLETYTRSAAGTEMTIVVPDSVQRTVPYEELLDTYAFAESNIAPRIPRDRMAVFVVPREWGGVGGYAVRNDIVMHSDVARIEGLRSVATHEYVHTLFGVFGGSGTYWLKEAIAQYYGYLVALNVGAGSFAEFRSTVTAERHRDAVLADSAQMQRTNADYEKGAHVLAALDAEIQRVSDGSSTLNDVFTTGEHDLSTYAGFDSAVVDVSGSSSLSQWLDRYVRAESLPDIPDDPEYFVLGDQSPDSLRGTESPATEAIGDWKTTTENDASVRRAGSGFTIRAYKCSSGSATRAVEENQVTVSFDYEIEAEQWWERPYLQVLEDGEPIWSGSIGDPDLYDERIFDIAAGGVERGRVEKTVTGAGPLEVRLGITPSESCSGGDHGTTWLRVSNLGVESQSAAPEANESEATTATDTPTGAENTATVSTDSETATTTGSGGADADSPTETSAPGFGIGSAIGGLAGVGYLLSRTKNDE